ncbi:DUF6507 family protein [Streptomyces sp. NPDC059850]|uniref:DUF6507 family protein n=1 Tax=Streptomyces sp. NPDC059850 TaxID=3346970 RepID=UPI003664FFAC
MSGWDITPSGVEFVTSLVGDAIDDIDTGVKSYGKNVESAATAAGTISEPYCGAPRTGPVGAALALFIEKTTREALFIGARAAKSVNGAREATALYVAGHHCMAADAQHKALAAPKIDLPGDDKRGGGHK